MDKNEIIEKLADAYSIERNEEGEYDLSDYSWQSGCYLNHEWFSLAEVVNILSD